MKKYFKERVERIEQNGFSLIELVVAVGVILVLSTGGLLAYNGVMNNARNGAVQKAAKEVLTGAAAYQADGKAATIAKDAETEWNATSKKDTSGKAQIAVVVDEQPTCLKVTATHVKGNEAIRQAGAGCIGDENGNGGDETGTPGGDDKTPGGNDGSTDPDEKPLCSEIDFDWEAAYWKAWTKNPPEQDIENPDTWGNWDGPTTPSCSGAWPYVPGPWHDPFPEYPGN